MKKSLLFLLFLFPPFSFSGAESPSKNQENNLHSIVQINIVSRENHNNIFNILTGVIVSDDLHIVTQYAGAVQAIKKSGEYEAIACIKTESSPYSRCSFSLKFIAAKPESHIAIFQVSEVSLFDSATSQESRHLSREEYLQDKNLWIHTVVHVPECLDTIKDSLEIFQEASLYGFGGDFASPSGSSYGAKPQDSCAKFKGMGEVFYHSRENARVGYTFDLCSEEYFSPGSALFDADGYFLGMVSAYSSSSVFAVPALSLDTFLKEEGITGIPRSTSEEYCAQKEEKYLQKEGATSLDNIPDAHKDLLSSVVQIEVLDYFSKQEVSSGSGVILSDTGDILILTNHHVIKDSLENKTPLEIRACISHEAGSPSDCLFEVTVIASSKDSDLALLKVTWVRTEKEKEEPSAYFKNHPIPFTVVKKFPKSPLLLPIQKGDPLFIYGYPGRAVSSGEIGSEVLFFTKTVLNEASQYPISSSKFLNILVAKDEVFFGNSGGPVFSEDGTFLGVVFAVGKGEGESPHSLIIPYSVILEFIQEKTPKSPLLALFTSSNTEKEKKNALSDIQKEQKGEVHILRKKIRTVLLDALLVCKEGDKSARKACLKESLISFLKERTAKKREFLSACRKELPRASSQEIQECFSRKIEEEEDASLISSFSNPPLL